MRDADRLRAQKSASTDPDRLEREARMAEARDKMTDEKVDALAKIISPIVKRAIESGSVKKDRVAVVLLEAFLESGALDAEAEATVRGILTEKNK